MEYLDIWMDSQLLDRTWTEFVTARYHDFEIAFILERYATLANVDLPIIFKVL